MDPLEAACKQCTHYYFSRKSDLVFHGFNENPSDCVTYKLGEEGVRIVFEKINMFKVRKCGNKSIHF